MRDRATTLKSPRHLVGDREEIELHATDQLRPVTLAVIEPLPLDPRGSVRNCLYVSSRLGPPGKKRKHCSSAHR